MALKLQKYIYYYLKITGNQNVCNETFINGYNSEHEVVTCWSHKGYIAPLTKNYLLVWYNEINHFNGIKYGLSFQLHTTVVDSIVVRKDKYLPVNNKKQPQTDKVINIGTKKHVQILPVSWDHTYHNTNPPPFIDKFKLRQSLLRGSYVQKQDS